MGCEPIILLQWRHDDNLCIREKGYNYLLIIFVNFNLKNEYLFGMFMVVAVFS